MTKKAYIKLAEILKRSLDEHGGDTLELDDLIKDIADGLKKDNLRFDCKHFLWMIYGPSEVCSGDINTCQVGPDCTECSG